MCQIGAERALKGEVARVAPSLKSAFARPGLVTWKGPAEAIGPAMELELVFARAWAVALGPAKGVEEVRALAQAVAEGRKMRLHAWDREAHRPGEGPEEPVESARAGEVRRALLDGGGFSGGEVARSGDHVLDVVVAGEEPLFVGHHVHSRLHSPHAGGRIPVEVPAEAPSRAYRKVEEAIAWSGAKVRAGQVAVEIGSAPGGASHALLRRGLEVVGIDPGAMDEAVLANPRFRHVQKAVGEVAAEELPAKVDWLLLDVNLAPQVALHSVRGLVAARRRSLRGVLFTLKLNDWGMAAKVPEFLRRIKEMGMEEVRATQLPANRQEIFVWGRVRGR